MSHKAYALMSLTLIAALLMLSLPAGSATPSAAALAITTTNISIPSGAGTPPSGWTSGSTTPFGWSPLTVKVVIGVNNTVTWTNDDTVPHTVTSLSTTDKFDSGNMNAAATYTHTFTTPGTYTITCDYHAWMIGTVVVSGPSTSSASSTVPEFPAAALGVILLVLVAAAMLASGKGFQKSSTTVSVP